MPPADPTPSRFYRNEEAARYLGLSPRTLEKYRVIGGGPIFRKLGRCVVYAVDDLDRWADARSRDMT
nr:helix-turn-helix domain-containing protein [Sphingomonas sp. Y57]